MLTSTDCLSWCTTHSHYSMTEIDARAVIVHHSSPSLCCQDFERVARKWIAPTGTIVANFHVGEGTMVLLCHGCVCPIAAKGHTTKCEGRMLSRFETGPRPPARMVQAERGRTCLRQDLRKKIQLSAHGTTSWTILLDSCIWGDATWPETRFEIA